MSFAGQRTQEGESLSCCQRYKTMDKKYEYFLQSPEWQKVSQKMKSKYPRCDICGRSDSLVTHHTIYTDNLLDERFLVVLCQYCHECFHRAFDKFKALHDSSEGHVILVGKAKELLSKAALDFYKNSFLISGSKINVLNNSDAMTKHFFDFLKSGIASRIPVPIFRSCYNQCRLTDVNCTEESQKLIVGYRRSVVKSAVEFGLDPYFIKSQFKMSDAAFNKIYNSL